MQVLDYRHTEPTPSPPHNSSWLLDNQPTVSPVPQPSSSPPHHSIPLVSSNSLTGISSHHTLPSSTPLHTSSFSTRHPSSHPSLPRDTPLTHNSPLNTLTAHENLNITTTTTTTTANNSNIHSSLSKFGNLLNVSNVAIEHDREHNQITLLSRSVSNQPEVYKDLPPHSYPAVIPSVTTPLERRQNTQPHSQQNHFKQQDINYLDRNDPYQPMHRPHFSSQACNPPIDAQRQENFNAQQASSYQPDYSRQTSHVNDNNTSPPYPGTAPVPVYKERTYGIPKFSAAIGSQTDGLCPTGSSSIPSFKPISNDPELTSRAIMGSRSPSPTPANNVQMSRSIDLQDFAVGGTLLRDTIKAFEAKGMNPQRSEFLRDYTELMKAYEEKCDVVYDATERVCMELTLKSRVPFLEDTMTAPVDDETPDDARQKLVVKKKFVEAMEALQGDQLPTKRRGNLPKECTEYLKKWFDEHYDHPYPTDDEKLEMSKRTKIGMSQISHWFINYRKRVWKPSLPANHPALSGDHSKTKPRKKQKMGEDATN